MSVAVQEKPTNIFERLPNEFSRREALEKTYEAGYSRSWLWQKIEEGLIKGYLKRIDHGQYRKTISE